MPRLRLAKVGLLCWAFELKGRCFLATACEGPYMETPDVRIDLEAMSLLAGIAALDVKPLPRLGAASINTAGALASSYTWCEVMQARLSPQHPLPSAVAGSFCSSTFEILLTGVRYAALNLHSMHLALLGCTKSHDPELACARSSHSMYAAA